MIRLGLERHRAPSDPAAVVVICLAVAAVLGVIAWGVMCSAVAQ